LQQTNHIQITYGYATNVTNNIPCKTHNNYIRVLCTNFKTFLWINFKSGVFLLQICAN